MTWKTEALLAEVKDFLLVNPRAGRQSVAENFNITDYKARELIRDIKGEEELPPLGITIGYFDLETTKLIADMGVVLIGSILSYPSMKMTTYRIDEYERDHLLDDGPIVKDIRDKLLNHHLLCGFFSKGFDIPFLNARLVQNGLDKVPNHLHWDPIYQYKGWHGLKIGSSSMKNVAEFLGLDEQKMAVPKDIWKRAGACDPEALDVLVDRCESDVRVLAKIAQKTLDAGLVKNIQRYA